MMTTLTGIIIVLMMVVTKINELFEMVRNIFNL